MGQPEPLPEVLNRFATGELGAFEILFRQFQSEVYGWIVRIVRDPSAAEDLTVETFWRIYRAHARFDPDRSFGAWARRIATNIALDHLKSTQGKAGLTVTAEASDCERLPAVASTNPGVQLEIRERTQRAFRQLPAKLQLVATLALIEERPHHEIAEALDISTAAVKTRLFRAVRLLRKKLNNLRTGDETA
jgi:RNA polymerase sigma-70 factor, ECF subfamily